MAAETLSLPKELECLKQASTGTHTQIFRAFQSGHKDLLKVIDEISMKVTDADDSGLLFKEP